MVLAPHHADPQPAARDLVVDRVRARLGPVATEREEHVHPRPLQGVDHGRDRRPSPRAAEDAPAELVDVADRIEPEREGLVRERGVEATVAVLEAEDRAHPLAVMELEDDRNG
jgi:hypothetical protein